MLRNQSVQVKIDNSSACRILSAGAGSAKPYLQNIAIDNLTFVQSLTLTVDRFANNLNRKLKYFNSKFYCPGTSHVHHLLTIGASL